MKLRHTALLLFMLTACASTAPRTESPETPDPGQPAPPPADASVLPASTHIQVALNDSLSSERTRVGDRFTATVTQEIVAQNGQVVVPIGAVITGLVTGVDDTDHAGDPAYVRLNFIRLTIETANHPFAAEVVSTGVGASIGVAGEEGGAKELGIDAAAGALGAIISGEARQALEAAALGAGAGTVIGLGTDAARAVLPAGTALTLRTTAHIGLRTR